MGGFPDSGYRYRSQRLFDPNRQAISGNKATDRSHGNCRRSLDDLVSGISSYDSADVIVRESFADSVRQAFRVAPASLSETELVIGGVSQVCSWEAPIQSALADYSIPSGRDVLEVGYGIGLCSDRLKVLGLKSHWILEAHPIVAQLARVEHPEATVIETFWEEFAQTNNGSYFGSIIFDAYPLCLGSFNGSVEHCRKFVEQAILVFQNFLTEDGRGTVIDFSCALEEDERLHHAAATAGLGYEAARIQVTIPEDCEYAAGGEACVLVFSRLGDEKCGLPSDL